METNLSSLVIYSDDSILVINKPAGLRTLPDGYDPNVQHVNALFSAEFGKLWIVHRLDKETSGVLVLARNAAAHRLLNSQFDQHEVTKVYHAIVNGIPAWRSKTIQSPLRINGDRHHRTIIDPQLGKPSETHCRVLKIFSAHTLLEIQPKTGRTHQIRAHLASIGFPILQDELYHQKHNLVNQTLIARLALHACSIEFVHPEYNTKMHFSAPYPEDFQNCLDTLLQQSAAGRS